MKKWGCPGVYGFAACMGAPCSWMIRFFFFFLFIFILWKNLAFNGVQDIESLVNVPKISSVLKGAPTTALKKI